MAAIEARAAAVSKPSARPAPPGSAAPAAAPSSAAPAVKVEVIDLCGSSSPPAEAAAVKEETIDLSGPASLPAQAAAVKEEAIDLTSTAIKPEPSHASAAQPPALPAPAVQASCARALWPAADQASAGSQGLQAATCPAASQVQPKQHEASQPATSSVPDGWSAMMSSVISNWNK
jgi:hypothetical protein